MIHTLDLNFLGDPNSIAAYLVETEVGPLLFETGPYSTFPYLKKAVEDLGYQLTDIRHVFLSHIHLDHAGAAWALAEHGATIYVHPRGEKHLAEPERLMSSATRIYGEHMDRLWGAMNPIAPEQLQIMEDGEKVKIGGIKVRAWHTPGHAVHHIAWQVENVNLIAGDVAGVKIKQGIAVPPCPPPDINLEDWERSIRFILSRRYDCLYLSHFGEIKGTKNIKLHLTELRSRLRSWANWIKPYYEQGMSPAEITPKFEEYVNNQYKAAEMPEDLKKYYQNANPEWMSVAGLLRYWKKQEG
ncbi:MAG: MBL fold metallo-hydrolase [Saprospiraceae bacterium]